MTPAKRDGQHKSTLKNLPSKNSRQDLPCQQTHPVLRKQPAVLGTRATLWWGNRRLLSISAELNTKYSLVLTNPQRYACSHVCSGGNSGWLMQPKSPFYSTYSTSRSWIHFYTSSILNSICKVVKTFSFSKDIRPFTLSNTWSLRFTQTSYPGHLSHLFGWNIPGITDKILKNIYSGKYALALWLVSRVTDLFANRCLGRHGKRTEILDYT